jgi:CheY-like chemotaxis protein/nitrogen-specific signal transduction histidine kinase
MEQIRASQESGRRFLRYVFHEIRVPLNSLVLGIEVLKKEAEAVEADKSCAEVLEVMEESTTSMSTILNDVLSFQKIEEGRFDLELAPFSLESVLFKAVASFKTSVTSKKLKTLVHYDSTIPVKVIGDKTRIKQVLQNLISNSIKFSKEGSELIVTAKRNPSSNFIKCDEGERETNITVSVTDFGIGISPEDKARLFQPYVQIRPGDLQEGRGSGLGLSICRQIIQAHGGEIDVISSVGAGSTFFFKIPFKIPRASVCKIEGFSPQRSMSTPEEKLDSETFQRKLSRDEIAESPPKHRRCASESPKHCSNSVAPSMNALSGRVLVVDDVRSNRKLLQVAMEKLNFSTQAAADGVEALEKISTGQFDLILLDNVMPRMTGVELCKKLRASGNNVLVLGITGNALQDDIEEFKSAGANQVLTKPVQISKLKEVLESFNLFIP